MRAKFQAAVQTAGAAATPLFALYNGALGLWHGSLWHGSICVYYLLLALLRGLLLTAQHRSQAGAERQGGLLRLTSVLLLLLNVALIPPVSLMVLDARPVRLGLIPAIACAAYTTYKITAACVKLKRKKAGSFPHQLDRLGFVDALVSILVLQNTLLTAVDGAVTREMLPVAAASSAGILLVIFVLSVLWLIRDNRRQKFTP